MFSDVVVSVCVCHPMCDVQMCTDAIVHACVAARAVDLLKRVPEVKDWVSLLKVLPEGRDELPFPQATVCAAKRNVRGAPSSGIRLFGPRGLLFESERGKQVARIRSGHDDVDAHAGFAAQHLSVNSGYIVVCGLTPNLTSYLGNVEFVDIRWLQLLHDVGEMLLCHRFEVTGCTCPRHVRRRPEIHESSAQLLMELQALQVPTLSALLMLYVIACTHALAPRERRRGRVTNLWHTAVAKAVSMAVGLRFHCMDRWGAASGTCAALYMSVLAALPSAILAKMGAPFEPDAWEEAMGAARTRQGSSTCLDEVRSDLCRGSNAVLLLCFLACACLSPWPARWASPSRPRIMRRADPVAGRPPSGSPVPACCARGATSYTVAWPGSSRGAAFGVHASSACGGRCRRRRRLRRGGTGHPGCATAEQIVFPGAG